MERVHKYQLGESETQMPVSIIVTKYAFTQGAFRLKADIKDGGKFAVEARTDGGLRQMYHGNEFAVDEKQAIAQIEALRAQKIRSLEKSLEKVRKKVVKIPPESESDK